MADRSEGPIAYHWDLDVQLITTIESYEEGREEYWKTRTEGGDWDLQQKLFGHAEAVAKWLLGSLSDISLAQLTGDPPEAFLAESEKSYERHPCLAKKR